MTKTNLLLRIFVSFRLWWTRFVSIGYSQEFATNWMPLGAEVCAFGSWISMLQKWLCVCVHEIILVVLKSNQNQERKRIKWARASFLRLPLLTSQEHEQERGCGFSAPGRKSKRSRSCAAPHENPLPSWGDKLSLAVNWNWCRDLLACEFRQYM